jgi:hypothetical protein
MKSSISILSILFSTTIAENIYCSSLTYKGLTSNFDQWCQSTCNSPGSLPGYCPDSFCACAGVEEDTSTDYCESPRICDSGNYVANVGTVSSDGWCNSTCNANPANCPCSLCLCGGGGGGCGAGQTELVLNFDNFTGKSSKVPSGYKGFSWGNAFHLNTTAYSISNSGYKNGMVSPSNVLFSGSGNDIVISRPSFRVLSGYFNAAWQYNLTLVVEGKKRGLSVFVKEMDLNADSPLFYEFENLDLDELSLHSISGTNDPQFLGSGKHFLVDDLTVCLPSGELEKRGVSSRVYRRVSQRDDPTSDGPQ